MNTKIPKELLNSRYRKEMWKNSVSILKKLEKVLPVESAYLLGSFTTKKKRPADVDVILILKIKGSRENEKWSLDFVVAPQNDYGKFVVEDAQKWMKQKYGIKKSAFVKLK